MDTVDTTPPQNPRLKAPIPPEVKEGTASLAEVASEAESSRGRTVDLKNVIEKSRNDAENLATKITLWSRFMASSYQQATKYPALRPLVRVMEQYNVIWRSIMNSAFMGRSLVNALDADNKARYREVTELKNTVNQNLSISGLDGNKRLVLNLTDPTIGVDPLVQLYGERNPSTGERTGEYTRLVPDPNYNPDDPQSSPMMNITVPALFKYKDIYGYTTLSEAEYRAKYPDNQLVIENDPNATPEQNERTQRLITAMEQEQNTIRTLYDQAITAVITRGLGLLEPSIKSQVQSAEASIEQELKSAGEPALTEGELVVRAMERVAEEQERRAQTSGTEDTSQNVRNAEQLREQMEVIGNLRC